MYSVYAIPGPAGDTLMKQLSWYSGHGVLPSGQRNISTGLAQGKPGDMRLFTLIDLGKNAIAVSVHMCS